MGTPPAANPSGPVQRHFEPSRVDPAGKTQAEIRRDTAALAASRKRGNDASTSRARGAAAAGFVKGGQPGKRSPETRERMRTAQLASWERRRAQPEPPGPPPIAAATDGAGSVPEPTFADIMADPLPGRAMDEQQAFCAHISGIEHVVVTQAQGSKYEWWRCTVCRTEFRPTGEPAHGEAASREDRP
jgi:hypothetical protein